MLCTMLVFLLLLLLSLLRVLLLLRAACRWPAERLPRPQEWQLSLPLPLPRPLSSSPASVLSSSSSSSCVCVRAGARVRAAPRPRPPRAGGPARAIERVPAARARVTLERPGAAGDWPYGLSPPAEGLSSVVRRWTPERPGAAGDWPYHPRPAAPQRKTRAEAPVKNVKGQSPRYRGGGARPSFPPREDVRCWSFVVRCPVSEVLRRVARVIRCYSVARTVNVVWPTSRRVCWRSTAIIGARRTAYMLKRKEPRG